jgi:hypothetical protein
MNVYSIIKIIFRKKNDNFFSRFSEKNPITAINPLTNRVSIFKWAILKMAIIVIIFGIYNFLFI